MRNGFAASADPDCNSGLLGQPNPLVLRSREAASKDAPGPAEGRAMHGRRCLTQVLVLEAIANRQVPRGHAIAQTVVSAAASFEAPSVLSSSKELRTSGVCGGAEARR